MSPALRQLLQSMDLKPISPELESLAHQADSLTWWLRTMEAWDGEIDRADLQQYLAGLAD